MDTSQVTPGVLPESGMLRRLRLLAAFGPAALAVPLLAITLHSPSPTWAFEYYFNPSFSGQAVNGAVHFAALDTAHNALAPGLPEREDFSLRLTTCFHPPTAGPVLFRLTAYPSAKLFVDGSLVIDTSLSASHADQRGLELGEGHHKLTIEYANGSGQSLLRTEVAFPTVYDVRELSSDTELPGRGGTCTAG